MLMTVVRCVQVVEGEMAAALSNGAHGVDIHVPAAVHSTSHDASTGKHSPAVTLRLAVHSDSVSNLPFQVSVLNVHVSTTLCASLFPFISIITMD